jgi:hypothetical protein
LMVGCAASGGVTRSSSHGQRRRQDTHGEKAGDGRVGRCHPMYDSGRCWFSPHAVVLHVRAVGRGAVVHWSRVASELCGCWLLAAFLRVTCGRCLPTSRCTAVTPEEIKALYLQFASLKDGTSSEMEISQRCVGRLVLFWSLRASSTIRAALAAGGAGNFKLH